MCRFIETIRVERRRLCNLELHQERVDHAFSKFFPGLPVVNLGERIDIPAGWDLQTGKCRVVYTEKVETVEFLSARKFAIRSLQIVESKPFDYEHKYADRETLNTLYNQRKKADDIIISINGRPTDSLYTNLVFFDGKNWFTPVQPLLKGTKRKQLLKTGVIKEADIMTSDIGGFKKVSLVNTMLNLGALEIPCDRIYR